MEVSSRKTSLNVRLVVVIAYWMLDLKEDLQGLSSPIKDQSYVKSREMYSKSNCEGLWTNCSSAHYTVEAMDADDLFESLYCLHWTRADVSSSQRSTRIVLLNHANDRVRIWRKQHKSIDHNCIFTAIQASGGNIVISRMFTWFCSGPLIPVE